MCQCGEYKVLAMDKTPTLFGLQGVKRRVIYVTLYELIAIGAATVGLALLTGQGAGHSSVVAVAASVIAIVWNIVFNWAFERWEARQPVRGRSVARRVAHAIGFQLTLVVYLIPLIAWWLGMSLWEAFVVDLAFIILIPCYTFLYNWLFDRVFGLPSSASAQVSPAV